LRARINLNHIFFRHGTKYPFFPSESLIRPLVPWETQTFMLFLGEKMVVNTIDISEKIHELNPGTSKTETLKILFGKTAKNTPPEKKTDIIELFDGAIEKDNDSVPKSFGISIFRISEKVTFVSFYPTNTKFTIYTKESDKNKAVESIRLWLEECDTENAIIEFLTRINPEFKDSAEIKRHSNQWLGDRLVSLDRIYSFGAEPYIEEKTRYQVSRPEDVHDFSARTTSDALLHSLAIGKEPPRSLVHTLKLDISLIVAGVFYLGHMTIGYPPVKYVGMNNVIKWIRESGHRIMEMEFLSDKFALAKYWDSTMKSFELAGLTEVAKHMTSGNPLEMAVIPVWDFSLYEKIIREKTRVIDALITDPIRDLAVILLRNCDVETATTTIFAELIKSIPSASPPETIKSFLESK